MIVIYDFVSLLYFLAADLIDTDPRDEDSAIANVSIEVLRQVPPRLEELNRIWKTLSDEE